MINGIYPSILPWTTIYYYTDLWQPSNDIIITAFGNSVLHFMRIIVLSPFHLLGAIQWTSVRRASSLFIPIKGSILLSIREVMYTLCLHLVGSTNGLTASVKPSPSFYMKTGLVTAGKLVSGHHRTRLLVPCGIHNNGPWCFNFRQPTDCAPHVLKRPSLGKSVYVQRKIWYKSLFITKPFV